MNHVARLVREHFACSAEVLKIGDLPVTAIASRYGTPSFVYDRGVMTKRVSQLRAVFRDEIAIYYSAKANPHRSVVAHFVRLGCGVEIASKGEYLRALEARCDPRKIVFAGPGKSEAEIELVLAKGIGELHIESLTELDRISSISRRLGLRASVAVRINPTAEAQGGAMRMGGKPSQFGVDEEGAEAVVARVLECGDVDFTGIHLFTGTQILDPAILLTQYRKAVGIARGLAAHFRRPMKTIDFGGGLGVPYFPHEQELDVAALSKGLDELVREVRADPWLSGARLIVEPGRFLVGEAGIYVMAVSDIKISRGKKFVIVDGGMHHHLAASGNLGQTIKRNYPVALLNRLTEPPCEKVDVVGPLCTPLDTLARDIDLPETRIGDLVGIFQSGAYGLTASPTQFLSHPPPNEIVVEQGRIIDDPALPVGG
jgi:diaminopimelate decarboxylase